MGIRINKRAAWALCVLTGGAVLLGCGLLVRQLLLPWLLMGQYFPEGVYVSGRPDLTRNADADAIQFYIRANLADFLAAHGLKEADVADLRIAAGVRYRHGVLFTFRLAPEKRAKLLRGKKQLTTSGGQILAAGPVADPHVRSIDPPESEDYTARADLSYLWTVWPYNRLDWWPPPEPEQQGLVVYKGPLAWRQAEVAPDTCYIFINPKTDSVYVAGDGTGTQRETPLGR